MALAVTNDDTCPMSLAVLMMALEHLDITANLVISPIALAKLDRNRKVITIYVLVEAFSYTHYMKCAIIMGGKM